MIKILFFIETLEGGGAEKVLCNLVNNMDQTKFDITVQTAWPCDFEKYLVKGIKFKSMYSVRNSLNNMRYRIEAETGLAYKLHIKDDYDIECAFLEFGSTKIMASSTNKNAKKLAWVHCDLTKAVNNPAAFAEKTRHQYDAFNKIICVSQNVRDSFIGLFGKEYDVDVIYNVIDDNEIQAKAQLPLPDNTNMPDNTVVSLGRLSKQKNYMRLLKTHKRLLDEGVEHNVWILGEGPERGMLEQYISENGIGDTAKLLGFKDNPYPFLREAELLVCSSDFEGFSTFVTEGIILGRPVVTTDCTGMREILGNSEFGFVTELNDEAFYEGMKKMLCDESLRKHYVDKAAIRGKDFSARALAVKTEKYFEELK